MALHSVWGSSAPPGTYAWHTDGTPSIWTAMGFYRTIAGTPVTAVVGARLWVSADAAAANSQVTVVVFRGGAIAPGGFAAVDAGFAAPVETKVMPIGGAGWNEVLFDNPVPADPAERIYLAVRYGASVAGYQHSGLVSGLSVLAENGMGFALGTINTSEGGAAFNLGGTGFAVPITNANYGLDIIFDDGAGSSDTEAPSVPTGLSIGTITHNSAVASWSASTDDTAVTGYEVFRDGASAGTTSSTTFNLTGLAPETEYSITVRARDAAANWSAQSGAQTFTTVAAPAGGGRWINHVAITAPPNGTTTNTVGPDAGTVAAGTLFTPTAGNLLLCVADGAVTSSTPTGWTLPGAGSAVNNGGLYVWWRVAAGGDSLTTTHNAADYPVSFHFFEFAAGSAFIGSGSSAVNVSSGAAGPALSGLTGTNLIMSALGRNITATAGTGSATWSPGEEIIDALVYRPGGTVDGYHYSLAIQEDFAGAGTSMAASWTGTAAGSNNAERLIFAIAVAQAPSDDTEAPSVPAGVEVSPAAASATIEWNASTDNVGVTSYEVAIDGTPVGTPTATLLHVTGLTPSTTYEVTVRARDSAANWSANSAPVEFTTLAAARLTIAEENALPGTDRGFWYDLGGCGRGHQQRRLRPHLLE